MKLNRTAALLGLLTTSIGLSSDSTPAPELTVEPPVVAPIAPAWVTCDRVIDCDSPCCGREGRGTLFIWNTGRNVRGGPDLDGPLVTDRPDFTEASVTVGRGVSQIEFGYTYTYDSDGASSTRNSSWGEPLLRQGMFADWFEFRIAVFPVVERRVRATGVATPAGTEDLYLGAKLALTPQDGWLPEMALIPQTTVPTGSRAFTNDQVLPGLNWIYGWEINDWIGTAGSTQFNQAIDEATAGTYTEWAQSWTIAYTLTDEVGAYTEWFALVPAAADTEDTQHYFNGGFTVLLCDDVQWDVRAGVGLSDASDDYFVGTGLSVRFH